MKSKKCFLGSVLLLGIFLGMQTHPQSLPAVDLFTLDGERVDASSISNEGMPMILVFFKTFDNDCMDNLVEINESYREQLKQKGVKMVAVCVDCDGKKAHVKPFVYGHDLPMTVYIDLNGDLKRSLGIPDAPFTILYDQEMKVYCQYNGYCRGSGDLVCHKITECLARMDQPEQATIKEP